MLKRIILGSLLFMPLVGEQSHTKIVSTGTLDLVAFSCGHLFCKCCMQVKLAQALKDNNMEMLCCPICRQQWTFNDITITADEEQEKQLVELGIYW